MMTALLISSAWFIFAAGLLGDSLARLRALRKIRAELRELKDVAND